MEENEGSSGGNDGGEGWCGCNVGGEGGVMWVVKGVVVA